MRIRENKIIMQKNLCNFCIYAYKTVYICLIIYKQYRILYFSNASISQKATPSGTKISALNAWFIT